MVYFPIYSICVSDGNGILFCLFKQKRYSGQHDLKGNAQIQVKIINLKNQSKFLNLKKKITISASPIEKIKGFIFPWVITS